jgi:hypothetical protein
MGESSASAIKFDDQNIEALSKQIMEKYKGNSINAKQLFDEHQPKTRYCGTHYAQTLRAMETRGMLKATFIDTNIEHKVSVLLTKNCILKFN